MRQPLEEWGQQKGGTLTAVFRLIAECRYLIHTSLAKMVLTIQFEREDDGRWIAEIPQLPGVLAYGETRDVAAQHVRALAFRVIADQIDSGELDAHLASVSFAA